MKHRTSLILYAVVWMMIVVLAFFMQAVPLLLIITMVNMALGVTSPVALIALPAALFGTVVLVCMRAARRRKSRRPVPVRVDEQRQQIMAMQNVMQNDGGLRLTELRRRWLY